MANKRMFSKEITNSDLFLDLSLSSQALYFHLGMNADDDGFVQPKSIMRLIQAKEADLIILAEKGFIIPFQNSVIVLTHWKINNELKNDRTKPTIYQQHLNTLILENKIYIQNNMLQRVPNLDPECIQNVSKMSPQYRLDKNRLDKNRLDCQDLIADDIATIFQEQKQEPKANAKALIFDFSFFTEDEKIAINNWLEYKKQIKNSYKTQIGLTTLCNELKKFKNNKQDLTSIINRSIVNNWKGLFEMKTNDYQPKEPDKTTNLKVWLKWKYKDNELDTKWWWWENLKGDPVSIQIRFFETKYEEACDYLGIDYINRVNEAHANGEKYLRS